MRILLVEDEAPLRETLAARLKRGFSRPGKFRENKDKHEHCSKGRQPCCKN